MMKFLLLAATLFVATPGVAGTHTIDLKNFAQPGRDCNQDIANVAQAFAAAAPAADLVSSACLAPSLGKTAASGRIVYLADRPIGIASSYVFDADEIYGYYHDPESCELALHRERPMFAAHVGAEPFAAYCYVASDYGAPRYRSRMDAVGRFGSHRKYVTSARLANLPIDSARFQQDVLDLLLKRSNLQVVSVGIGYAPGGWRISADYYAERQIQLHAAMNFSWQSTAACELAMQDLQNQWDQHDEVSPSSFQCIKPSSIQGARGVQVMSLGTGGARDRVALNILPNSFASESGCVAELLRVRELYTSKGQKIYASACGLDDYQRSYIIGLWL